MKIIPGSYREFALQQLPATITHGSGSFLDRARGFLDRAVKEGLVKRETREFRYAGRQVRESTYTRS